MSDLTVIYITASEIKESFAEYQREILKIAAKNYPIISISKKQLNFGDLNLIDEEPRSTSNIYWQMLKAGKLATTPYIAIAEDDTLYHENHFKFYRPELDVFAYNQNRFALFTWGDPIYSWRNRRSNCSLIAPRELMIEALEERFAKWPQGTPPKITGELGRNMVDRNLRIIERKSIEQFSEVSIIQVNHSASSEELQRNQRKKMGQIKAYDLYHWGHAKNIREIYEDN
jgi:hypothetical protein